MIQPEATAGATPLSPVGSPSSPAFCERRHRGLARRLRHAKYAAARNSPVHTSSARHRSGCGMHLLLRCRESRIEYRLARLRAGSGRGGPGCVAHDGTRQTLGSAAKASRRRCEFDQMPEVPFVRKADDLALATSHLAQPFSASRVTAGAGPSAPPIIEGDFSSPHAFAAVVRTL